MRKVLFVRSETSALRFNSYSKRLVLSERDRSGFVEKQKWGVGQLTDRPPGQHSFICLPFPSAKDALESSIEGRCAG
jgi:hypothetical protein